MSSIAKDIGRRLKSRRLALGYTQEYTAEKANLHPTYIGQVERGEKNITVESLEKICLALEYSMEDLFRNIVPIDPVDEITVEIVNIISSQTEQDKRTLLRLLKYLIEYKKK